MLKSTGAIRICGDYKGTINQAVKVDKYPIPNINDLFTKLTGGVMYTKLDLSHAYQQVVLDEESCKLTTINTSKGFFEYERLPYGVSSSPGIFQRIMEQLFQNIPMTVVYLDDVLVTGKTPEEHDRNLEIVLSRLQEAGLHLKREKCTFDRSHASTCVMKLMRKEFIPRMIKSLPSRMLLHRRMFRSCAVTWDSYISTTIFCVI